MDRYPGTGRPRREPPGRERPMSARLPDVRVGERLENGSSMSQRRDRHDRDRDDRRDYPGVILLITLVILVILATLGYTLSVQVLARRHRDQYFIDYCQARHACASGLKYALASLGALEFQLLSRPNEPDFSDVFALSEPEYQKLLKQVAQNVADSNMAEADRESGARESEDTDDINDVNDPNSGLSPAKPGDIPGPYGPPWPLVTEPIEFEIGSARVKIEIEDENAKYPLGWAILADEKVQAEAGVGWVTFCEWMGYTSGEIEQLKADLARIREMKPFKTEFKPETQTIAPPASLRGRITRPTPTTATSRRVVTKRPLSVADQIERQNKDLSKLFHSSLLNADLLSRPSIVSDSRRESALKYLGLWATRQVNVNTAPRHVLEAALAFGSVADAPKMAEAVIQQRRVRPVADVNELKQTVRGYSNSIDKCKDFLVTTSTVFTVKVTAVSGVAQATAVAAFTKEADKIKRIAVISD
jgi:hypothetical protein